MNKLRFMSIENKLKIIKYRILRLSVMLYNILAKRDYCFWLSTMQMCVRTDL